METHRKKTKTVRLVSLTREETLSQPAVLECLNMSAKTPINEASTLEVVRVKRSSEKLTSAWTSSVFKEQSMVIKKATASAAASAEKPNTAQTSGTPSQNPSTSVDVGSTSEWRQ